MSKFICHEEIEKIKNENQGVQYEGETASKNEAQSGLGFLYFNCN